MRPSIKPNTNKMTLIVPHYWQVGSSLLVVDVVVVPKVNSVVVDQSDKINHVLRLRSRVRGIK